MSVVSRLLGESRDVTKLETAWRRCLANDPTTAPEDLARLSLDDMPSVVFGVLSNPNTPVGTLERFWRSRFNDAMLWHDEILDSLAKNPSTPEPILYELACDCGRIDLVMSNPACTKNMLARLARRRLGAAGT